MDLLCDDLLAAKRLINTIDLSAVLKRLVVIEGWKNQQAKIAIQQYRNYVFLRKKYPQYQDYELPPSYEIDEVWHAHVLHTKDYVNFCDQVFNGYLHHSPHHGQDRGLSLEKLENLFAETQRLYLEEFGEPLYSIKRIPFKKRPTKRNLKKLMSEAVI